MRTRLLVCCAAVLAMIAACGNGRNTTTDTEVGLGQPGSDGQFTFTALSFECGARELSRGLIRVEATGTYCLLGVRIENTGDAGRRFVATSQRLIDDEGRLLDVAQRETVVINTGEIGTELNPGLAIEVVLVFDVADTGAIVAAELHDGVLSRGVRVELRG